jgi:hypothetical protein
MTLNTTNLGASSPLPEGGKSLRIPIERTSNRADVFHRASPAGRRRSCQKLGVMNHKPLPSATEWGHMTQRASPEELIQLARSATESGLHNCKVFIHGPEACTDAESYSRVSVEIELPPPLADQLMNGPTGYRAHYSVSVALGEQFNRKLVEAVVPIIVEAERFYGSRFSRSLCHRSLLGPFSKFWYPKELTDPSAQAELLALHEVIRHPRWKKHWLSLPKPRKGLLAPVSENSSVLLNGSFVNSTGSFYEQKPGRSQHLFDVGWT